MNLSTSVGYAEDIAVVKYFEVLHFARNLLFHHCCCQTYHLAVSFLCIMPLIDTFPIAICDCSPQSLSFGAES
jgi:hypothetical protein